LISAISPGAENFLRKTIDGIAHDLKANADIVNDLF